jgi:glycerol-3-phosphate dehydrogenase (NAD(P)+)
MVMMNKTKSPVSVIGAGSWGSALALLISAKGYKVNLWDIDDSHIENLKKDHENRRHLPGTPFNENIYPTTDLSVAIKGCPVIVMVVPSHGFRNVFEKIVAIADNDAIVVSATKGIENESLLTMSQVIEDQIKKSQRKNNLHIGVLSGPSFAREVADRVPTAVTVASKNLEKAIILQKLFNTNYFRVYTSEDVIGLEISASLKNIVAIAAGICDGLGYGLNTRAALITRGLVEIARLGTALGAKTETFYGLSGMGDLVLTCTGDLSRNRSVGLNLGKGKKLQHILDEMAMVAEGVKTTKSVHDLVEKKGIEMPILEQVFQILYKDKDCLEAVNDLLNRELKSE